MSNEIKIAILAIVAIALSFWGYKFIKGKNLLKQSNYYKVYYDDVDGLKPGTLVRINGVDVGNVAAIELLPDEVDKVLVLIDLESGTEIPKDTRAVLVSVGFMGGKAINLEYDTPCSGSSCAESGATLTGVSRGLLGSMVGKEDMENYVEIVKEGLTEVLDTLNTMILDEDSDSPIARSMRDLSNTMANLNSSTGQLDNMLRRSSGDIEGTLSNINELTGTLESQKARIENILANADTLTSQLAQADIQQTLAEVDSAIKGLQSTLQTADQALAGISSVVNQLNNGSGTLGRLIQDDRLYNNLNQMTTQADSLFDDFQDRPYRYMPFKSRNKVQKYDRKDEGN